MPSGDTLSGTRTFGRIGTVLSVEDMATGVVTSRRRSELRNADLVEKESK